VRRVRVETRAGMRRATGVDLVSSQGAVTSIDARREVILSAGAIGSPHILQLSGIGPAALLQRHGIGLVHELPGVGENLQDHLQIRMVYKVQNAVTLNQRAGSVFGKMAMGLEYLLFKTGPLTMPPSQLGAFARSDSTQAFANIEWHVQPLSLDKFGDPLHSFPAITPSVCNLQPAGRGHVRIKSADPLAHPAIQPGYLATEADRRVAIDSMRFTRGIMAAPALRKYCPAELKPGEQVESDEALLAAAGDLGATIFHPVGTCKMGSDALAVVDDRLRVHGVAGLRVIDAAIMPRIISGNTNAPTVMIAEKGAEMVLADYDAALAPTSQRRGAEDAKDAEKAH
jgi:choline dehydrogenase